MVAFESPQKYKYIKEIKHILSRDHFCSPLKLGNFKELYNLLMASDVSPEKMGEFTKFIYNALKINPLNSLTEVPYFFLISTDLIEIEIPNNIIKIEDNAFANTKVKNIKLPPNLQVLGAACFFKCIELEEITIPKSLKEIGHNVFDTCPKLNKIYYEGTFKDFLKIKGKMHFVNTYRRIQCIDKTVIFYYPEAKWIVLDE